MQLQKLLVVLAAAAPAFAQSGVAVIGSAGYSAPILLTMAPGQIMTLFVPGFGNVVSGAVKARAEPLSGTLAGVSARTGSFEASLERRNPR